MSIEVLAQSIADHGKAVGDMKSEIMEELRQVKSAQSEIEQEFARIPTGGTSTRSVANPLDSFMESEQLINMQGGALTTGRVQLKDGKLSSLYNAITTGDVAIQPQRAPGLYDYTQPPLNLLDLLPTLKVSNGTFEYLALVTAADGANYQVAEGDLKAESNPVFEQRTATISTVAHWTQVSLQALNDAPALNQQLNNLMRYGVMSKLEAEILGGTGGPGEINGLLSLATPFVNSVNADFNRADRIGEAVTALGTAGWKPSAIVMSHADWFIFSAMKTSDLDYLFGSPRSPQAAVLWGLPVVLSAGMPSGQALVLDTNQVVLLDREQATVMMSREDGSNFRQNLATILAELRAGLAVLAPTAVVSVDLTGA